ncbi:MAG: hypothetical protein PHQ52_00245 [Candidatus Omnitrophica bacterium]|nr:hypothetical protein [Candidatus Omnitrophota bacterium]
MFTKKVSKLNDKQKKWLENLEHKGLNHFEFSEKLPEDQRLAFLRHSSFLDNTDRNAFKTEGLYDKADFANSVRADILYLETFVPKKKTKIIFHEIRKEESAVARAIRKQAFFAFLFLLLVFIVMVLFGFTIQAYFLLLGAILFFLALIFGSLGE